MSSMGTNAPLPAPAPEAVFRFGQKGLIVFLAFLNAFVPLSIDLYLPALPSMARFFASSDSAAKLTLSLFVLFFGVSMLLWGPFSDKYGRTRILRLGLVLYVGTSIWCGLAASMESLIAARIVQAIGCGAIQSASMAIVKDVFRGRVMENVLVYIQMMTILCPLLAPVVGAVLLEFMPWRGLFFVLMAGGAFGFLLSFSLSETLSQPLVTSPLRSLGRIGFVLKDKGFRTLLAIFSVTPMPFMAYLSSSAFIYENMFGTTSQEYSYFFAFNASCSMIGPFLYMRFLRYAPRVPFLAACFATAAVFGVLLILFGGNGPWFFALLFVPVTFAGSANRALGSLLLMTQLDSDNGTVAALMSSMGLFCGSFAMLLCSLGWSSLVVAVGSICVGSGLWCLVNWLLANHRKSFKMPPR